MDSEDTLKFAAANGIRPMIEVFPLERAADAMQAVIDRKVIGKAVLVG